MAKKEIKRHQKIPASGIWQAPRIEGKVRNRGIKEKGKKRARS